MMEQAGQNRDLDKQISHAGNPVRYFSLGMNLVRHVRRKDVPIVTRMLADGVSPDALDADRKSAMLVAIGDHNIAMVDALLTGGANPNLEIAPVPFSTTARLPLPLELAISEGFCDGVTMLIARGADLSRFSPSGRTPIQQIVTELPKRMPDRDAFVEACVLQMLDRGAEVDQPGSGRVTALHLAVTACLPGVVQLLLERGANPTSVDLEGLRPIDRLCRSDDVDSSEMLRILVEAGVLINSPDGRGRTIAFHHHPQPMFEAMMALGADIEHRDQDGRTPLLHAVANNVSGDRALSHLVMLVNAGTNVDARDNQGVSVMEYASRSTGQAATIIAATSARRAMRQAVAASHGVARGSSTGR